MKYTNLCFQSYIDRCLIFQSQRTHLVQVRSPANEWASLCCLTSKKSGWRGIFLVFLLLCSIWCLHGLTGLTKMFRLLLPPLSYSRPGLLLLGNSFLAPGFSSNISPFWKPDPIDTLTLCFQSILNEHLTETCTALHCHGQLTSLLSLWGACFVRVGLVSYFTQWSNQHGLLPLAAPSKCSINAAWSNEDLYPLTSLVKKTSNEHCVDYNLAIWSRSKTNLDQDQQSNLSMFCSPPTSLRRGKV